MTDQNDTHGLTPTQWRALGALPIPLTDTGNLPVWAPHAGTLKALRNMQLAFVSHYGWERTSAGRRLWESR